jgi:hypothetical protein
MYVCVDISIGRFLYCQIVCMYVLLLGLGCMIGERTHSRTLVGVEESTVRITYNVYVCMYVRMLCMYVYTSYYVKCDNCFQCFTVATYDSTNRCGRVAAPRKGNPH